MLGLADKIEKYYNIYHPSDPFAFRQEPLYYGDLSQDISVIPRWFSEDVVKGGLASGELVDARRRIDYTMQVWFSGGISTVVTGMSMLNAHSSYWKSRDIAALVLRELTGYVPEKVLDNSWTE
jgi:hypothetical protein